MQERRAVADESIANFLATVEMFSSFSSAELQQLALHADSRWYDFGDAVSQPRLDEDHGGEQDPRCRP